MIKCTGCGKVLTTLVKCSYCGDFRCPDCLDKRGECNYGCSIMNDNYFDGTHYIDGVLVDNEDKDEWGNTHYEPISSSNDEDDC